MKMDKKELFLIQQVRSTKAITLILLVITIIVLLILAGVSLSMVLSQDGILVEQNKQQINMGKQKQEKH